MLRCLELVDRTTIINRHIIVRANLVDVNLPLSPSQGTRCNDLFITRQKAVVQ